MATLDTHAIARSLTDAGADPKLGDVITAVVREAADHDNAVEPLATARDLAELEAPSGHGGPERKKLRMPVRPERPRGGDRCRQAQVEPIPGASPRLGRPSGPFRQSAQYAALAAGGGANCATAFARLNDLERVRASTPGDPAMAVQVSQAV